MIRVRGGIGPRVWLSAASLVSSAGFAADESAFTMPAIGALSALEVHETFTDHESFSLPARPLVYGLAVDATVELANEAGIVRVIMVDASGRDHLVYEAYPLLVGADRVTIVRGCEETCVLDGVVAASLKIQVENAKVELGSITWAAALDGDVAERGAQAVAADYKRRQDFDKATRLGANVKAAGLRWTPGVTTVAALSYAKKKELFKALEFVPAMQGFEFYRGGVFDLAPGGRVPASVTARMLGADLPAPVEVRTPGTVLPATWDWRAAHGENWVTPVRNQSSCGSCWAFGVLGALEASINAYYNQRHDVDLSEQDLVSCANIGGCSGALPDRAAKYVKERGVADEACFGYQARQVSCSNKCADWQSRAWTVGDYSVPANDDETFKSTIYTKGPFALGIYSWSHEMLAVGYRPKSAQNPAAGTEWIIKNSWGDGWGEDGYVTMTVQKSDRGWNVFLERPVLASDASAYEIQCSDRDNDGLCYWGLSEAKPGTCAATCSELKDCDDADAAVGACARR